VGRKLGNERHDVLCLVFCHNYLYLNVTLL
jgi:hypothetical protein